MDNGQDKLAIIVLCTIGLVLSIVQAIVHNKQLNNKQYDEESGDDYYS